MKQFKKLLTIFITVFILFLITSCYKEFEVTFLLNYNDLTYQTSKVKPWETIKEPTEPNRENYDFLGWYNEDELYDFNNEINKDLTLIAKWEKYYNIKFYLGYNNLYLDEQKVSENNKLIAPNNPIRDNYIFLGWYKNNELYNFDESINSEFTLTAYWEKEDINKSFKITYEASGGTLETTEINVPLGHLLPKPKDPTKEGYYFVGWYLNEQLYNFDLPIENSFTLTAVWEEIVYFNVTLTNLGNNLDDIILKIEKGTTIGNIDNPIKEGYIFTGWYYNDLLFDFNNVINEDITLTASFELEPPTVLQIGFNANGGEFDIVIAVTYSGHKIENPGSPTKEGFIFLGWYLEDELYDFDSIVNNEFTLVAKYEPVVKTYLIYFINIDGNYTPEPINIEEGETIDRPVDPTRENHIFLGWYSRGEFFDFNKPINDDYILTALWKDISDLVLISEFKLLEVGTVKTLSGIITSFAPYEYIIVEDASGAIKVKIDIYNSNHLKAFDINEGNKITFKATKTLIGGNVFAETNVVDIYNDGVFHNSLIIDINETPHNVLSIYENKLVTHSNLRVTKVENTNNKFTITLSRSNDEVIKAVYDTRYLFDGYSGILAIDVDDIVKINKAVLLFNPSPYVGLSNASQIIKTGEYVQPDNKVNFKIFYLNDTHGAILNNGQEHGMSKIGNYIKKTKDENSIFLTGGDIFQGQVISNYNKGALMVEILNHLELDAFVLGNHEFDWGLDFILRFFDDSNSDVKANFPLLAANLRNRWTNERPEFVDSHTIITRGNYKIGIVGVIGDGQESSIMRLKIEDYYFSDAFTAVSDTIEQIKSQVDFILVVNHDDSTSFNQKVAELPKVAAIFNGHLHADRTGYLDEVPYIQSGHSGHMVGEVDLYYEKTKSSLTLLSNYVKNVKYHTFLDQDDFMINQIIYPYYYEVIDLYEDVIIDAKYNLSRATLAEFLSKMMAKYTNSVFAFQNYGGTRTNIKSGPVTASDIFKVSPFDNDIVSVMVDGYTLKSLIDREEYSYLDIDYYSIDNNSYYRVATNDFSFFSRSYDRYFGGVRDDAEFAGNLYEVFYELLTNLKDAGYNSFDEDSPIIFNDPLVYIKENAVLNLIEYYA